MTTHEIAELLRVKEATVRGWIHGRELRAVRLGREFRVAVKDLEAFVNERATREPAWGAPSEGGRHQGYRGGTSASVHASLEEPDGDPM